MIIRIGFLLNRNFSCGFNNQTEWLLSQSSHSVRVPNKQQFQIPNIKSRGKLEMRINNPVRSFLLEDLFLLGKHFFS